ncbi:hypothetical protein CHUAL_011989 [Chamberlinius hualienensis]
MGNDPTATNPIQTEDSPKVDPKTSQLTKLSLKEAIKTHSPWFPLAKQTAIHAIGCDIIDITDNTDALQGVQHLFASFPIPALLAKHIDITIQEDFASISTKVYLQDYVYIKDNFLEESYLNSFNNLDTLRILANVRRSITNGRTYIMIDKDVLCPMCGQMPIHRLIEHIFFNCMVMGASN